MWWTTGAKPGCTVLGALGRVDLCDMMPNTHTLGEVREGGGGGGAGKNSTYSQVRLGRGDMGLSLAREGKLRVGRCKSCANGENAAEFCEDVGPTEVGHQVGDGAFCSS